MIKKINALLVSLFVIINSVCSQTSVSTFQEIGYCYDLNGTAINFYPDLSYQPKDQFEIFEKIRGEKIRAKFSLFANEELITSFDKYQFSYVTSNNAGYYNTSFYITDNNGERQRLKDLKGRFQNQLIELFPKYDIPKYIKESNKLNIGFIYSIIWLLKLECFHSKNEPLFLDKNSKAIEGKMSAKYFLKVDSITPENIYLKKYSVSGDLLLENKISFIEPNKKNGWIHYFNRTGILSKSKHYEQNRLDIIKTFYHNGNLFEIFTFQHSAPLFHSVLDSSGNEILDSNKNGWISFVDYIQKRKVYKQYKAGTLQSTFYLSHGVKKYLYTHQPASYKFFDKLYDNFNKEFKLKMSEKSSINEGISFFSCTVNKEGKIEDVSILSSVNELQDKQIQKWLASTTKKIFIPAKLNKTKVNQEVVIPLRYYSNTKDKYGISILWL